MNKYIKCVMYCSKFKSQIDKKQSIIFHENSNYTNRNVDIL